MQQKAVALVQAAINGALAITNVLATLIDPTPIQAFKAVAVAITIATVAAQIATIAAQPLAEGGIVQPVQLSDGKITRARNIPTMRNGDNVLATVRRGEVILNKRQLPKLDYEKEKIFMEVSKILEENIQDLKEKIKNEESNLVLISENLDHEKLILLETKALNLPGFKAERNTAREYEDGESFAHVIGYLGKITPEEYKENQENYSVSDYIGRTGIEKSYENILRKSPGKIKIERDVLGNQISKEIVSLPDSGQSLILWLDFQLQKKVEEELKKTIERVGAKKGIGIALNAKTGGI